MDEFLYSDLLLFISTLLSILTLLILLYSYLYHDHCHYYENFDSFKNYLANFFLSNSYIYIRDRLQISLLILSELKPINELPFPLKSSENQ